jgi:hypothetical protein
MKQTISILILAAMLYSCGNNSQNKALSDAKEVQSAIKQMQPGGIPTTEGGWTMKAKIDGKDWVANSIIPPDIAGRISGDNNGESIGLPYDRRDMVVGKKIKFSENNGVDLMTHDDVGIWGGRKGEMEITKVDDNWAEGKFSFTGSASSTTKTVEVTDGFFRISMAKPQK